MGTVTLSTDEFKELEGKPALLERRITELEAEVVRARLEDKELRVINLVNLVRNQMTLVKFAIANMPPEITRHWPTKALRVVATQFCSMPDMTADDQSLAIELVAFADEADQHERNRKAASAAQTELKDSVLHGQLNDKISAR